MLRAGRKKTRRYGNTSFSWSRFARLFRKKRGRQNAAAALSRINRVIKT
jgi:hypothetical protein